MEVSNLDSTAPDGQELMQTVVSLTGLPESWIQQELGHLIEVSGENVRDLTLDKLRKVLVAYLETFQVDPLDESPHTDD